MVRVGQRTKREVEETMLKMRQTQCSVEKCFKEGQNLVYYRDVDDMVNLCDYHYGMWKVRSIDPQE